MCALYWLLFLVCANYYINWFDCQNVPEYWKSMKLNFPLAVLEPKHCYFSALPRLFHGLDLSIVETISLLLCGVLAPKSWRKFICWRFNTVGISSSHRRLFDQVENNKASSPMWALWTIWNLCRFWGHLLRSAFIAPAQNCQEIVYGLTGRETGRYSPILVNFLVRSLYFFPFHQRERGKLKSSLNCIQLYCNDYNRICSTSIWAWC